MIQKTPLEIFNNAERDLENPSHACFLLTYSEAEIIRSILGMTAKIETIRSALTAQPEPVETVEGLAEAIKIESIVLDYGLYASACMDYKKKYGVNSSNVILQAARLWLRKQGE